MREAPRRFVAIEKPFLEREKRRTRNLECDVDGLESGARFRTGSRAKNKKVVAVQLY